VAVVVDHTGRLIAHVGDPDYLTFSRSSLKPFQALPTVARGIPDKLGLAERHIAVMCGSHAGAEIHVTAAQEILTASGSTVAEYQCGVHVPLALKPGDVVIPLKTDFTALYNNCSGKHAGMLALARDLGCPPEEYLEFDSPVQKLIRATVAEWTEVPESELRSGIDGCSAPNYAFPLKNLALGFAKMAHACQSETGKADQSAAARIIGAMRAHPELVSGTGWLDLSLAQASRGRWVTKIGAEGVECVAIPVRGWAVVAKIADGNTRALGPFITDILRQLGEWDGCDTDALEKLAAPQLRNHRDTVVGGARCVARLERV
jgi:L-asparaginase II